MKTVRLKPSREKSVLKKHPWVFTGAVESTEPGISAGDTVRVTDSAGKFIAYAQYNPHSQIRLRVMETDEAHCPDEAWWKAKIEAAVSRREYLLQKSDSARLVFAESDGIPGLIADRFGSVVVIQILTAGTDRMKQAIGEIFLKIPGVESVYEKSEADVRKLEGLKPSSGLLCGRELKEAFVTEGAVRFSLNLEGGQKTGFYLDQRENRMCVAEYARGKEVLDAFCYSGGFGLHCLSSGAKSVTALDSSEDALKLLKTNAEISNLDTSKLNVTEGDAFQVLRDIRDAGKKFDLIVLDPPKLAPTKVHLERAMKAYKDINLLAFKLLSRNGILATFSCSGGVSPEDFRKAVGWALSDSGRNGCILKKFTQAEDHPVNLFYPESEYLKGLLIRLD